MIEAIFFDIDGTLLSFNTHKVPQSAIDAIEILQKKGIKTFIATGRHRKEINGFAPLLFDAYITLNGSYCFDKENTVIHKSPLTKADMEVLIKIQQSDDKFPCFLGTHDDMILNFMNEQVDETYQTFGIRGSAPVPFDEWKKVAQGEIFQLVAFIGPEHDKKITEAMPDVSSVRWTPLFTDIIARDTNKQTGIDHILEHYNIPLENTMAFGDGNNDIQMLKHVGIGVAMGNAAEHVKQAADFATDTVDNDGILKGLQHYGLI